TETNITYNTARHDALTDSGIEYKSWLSSHGPKVRPGHEAAEEYYIDDPIPIDEPFIVEAGGETERLMFPRDHSLRARPANIINCQCIQLAATKEESDDKGTWFKLIGAGRMHFPHRAQRTIHHCHET